MAVSTLTTCEHCGAVMDEVPLTTPEDLLARILIKAPQYHGKGIPKPFLDACLAVLQAELQKRDRAIAQLKSMYTEEELLVGGRVQK